MLLKIPGVLTKEQVAQVKKVMLAADWTDGDVTAGTQSSQQKNNLQLPENSNKANELGDLILAALAKNNMFMSAALP